MKSTPGLPGCVQNKIGHSLPTLLPIYVNPVLTSCHHFLYIPWPIWPAPHPQMFPCFSIFFSYCTVIQKYPLLKPSKEILRFPWQWVGGGGYTMLHIEHTIALILWVENFTVSVIINCYTFNIEFAFISIFLFENIFLAFFMFYRPR